MDKNHVGFMSDDTTYNPHMEEAHIVDASKKIANAVTLEKPNSPT